MTPKCSQSCCQSLLFWRRFSQPRGQGTAEAVQLLMHLLLLLLLLVLEYFCSHTGCGHTVCAKRHTPMCLRKTYYLGTPYLDVLARHHTPVDVFTAEPKAGIISIPRADSI